jgi:ADP-dependent NAD(P)H-hydrate dehydratase
MTTSVLRITDLPKLPPRSADSHKGDFGHVLVVGGSEGMAGAPALAGMAALRSGAGLVTVACPDLVAGIVAGFEPSMMTLPLPNVDGGLAEECLEVIESHRSTVIALGPGLGRRPRTAQMVQRLLQEAQKPVVVDADALNSLVGSLECLRRNASTILTPHPGEFASLTGSTTVEVQANREALAVEFARTHDVVLALKGAGTIVTDGRQVFVNRTGNAGMATGGTGDVLTGIIAALVAQRLEPFAAACLGVHLHGLAGDYNVKYGAQESLIASDLVRVLPAAWRMLDAEED